MPGLLIFMVLQNWGYSKAVLPLTHLTNQNLWTYNKKNEHTYLRPTRTRLEADQGHVMSGIGWQCQGMSSVIVMTPETGSQTLVHVSLHENTKIGHRTRYLSPSEIRRGSSCHLTNPVTGQIMRLSPLCQQHCHHPLKWMVVVFWTAIANNNTWMEFYNLWFIIIIALLHYILPYAKNI